MNTLQNLVSASIEVAYSDALKNEMKINEQTDSVLARNIIKKIISKHCVGGIEVIIPTNIKERYSDICFDFKIISEDDLVIIQNKIQDELQKSLKSVEGFIFPDDD